MSDLQLMRELHRLDTRRGSLNYTERQRLEQLEQWWEDLPSYSRNMLALAA